ncbi:YgjV family protein [Methylobacterium sp. CM6247]
MSFLDISSAIWLAAQANLDAFGAMGLAFGFATSVMPRRTMILMCSAACGVCFSAHYLHLGSTTGMAMSAISVTQSLLAARFITSHGRPTWLNAAFAASMLMVAGLTLMTWNGWPSAFAGTGALFATAARLQASSQAMRLLLVCATLCCAGHNSIVGSVCGITCDVLAISGFVLTMARSSRFWRLPKSRASFAGC